jgi:hypothetical protein
MRTYPSLPSGFTQDYSDRVKWEAAQQAEEAEAAASRTRSTVSPVYRPEASA